VDQGKLPQHQNTEEAQIIELERALCSLSLENRMLPKQRECVHIKWALAKINIGVPDPFVFVSPGSEFVARTFTDPDPSLFSQVLSGRKKLLQNKILIQFLLKF
jgi:hypothetical protein